MERRGSPHRRSTAASLKKHRFEAQNRVSPRWHRSEGNGIYDVRGMSVRPPDLPDYDHPPVEEVVLGVQFQPLSSFSQAHVGFFWEELRGEFPHIEDQPRIDIPISSPVPPGFIGLPPRLGIPFNLGLHVGGPPNSLRTWITSADEQWLIQVQNDLFYHNWRKRGDLEYPRFEAAQQEFSAHWSQFLRFLANFKIDLPHVQQVEVTYINWITDQTVTSFFRPSSVTALSNRYISSSPLGQYWQGEYLLTDAGESIGSLSVSCQGAMRTTAGAPAVSGTQLVLTYRRALTSPATADDIAEAQRAGRRAIVESFTELTTKEGHAAWGRRR